MVGAMSWRRIGALALLGLTLPPNRQVLPDEPLEQGPVHPSGPLAETWTRRTAEVTAIRVRLNGLGARTHANWVLFRLPIDTTQQDRLRAVRFTPRSASPTEVGAFRFGSVCVPVPSNGGVETWALYTASGVSRTERYRRHPAPPTYDPTIAGINVPTRVANHVACGRDEGDLLAPENWTLSIEWEER